MNVMKRLFPHHTNWGALGLVLVVSLYPLGFDGQTAQGATYRCQDRFGTTVLTDNPVQLEKCLLLDSETNFPLPTAQEVEPEADPRTSESSDTLSSHTTTEPAFTDKAPKAHIQGEISVPLKKMGESFVVQVLLNHERPAQLILDTGASMTVLSTNIGIDLGILGTTDNQLLTVNTAGGSVQVNMNYLTALNVQSAQATHVPVAIHDLPDIPEHIEGLLGMSFLKHFLVTLDAEHARLILRKK